MGSITEVEWNICETRRGRANLIVVEHGSGKTNFLICLALDSKGERIVTGGGAAECVLRTVMWCGWSTGANSRTACCDRARLVAMRCVSSVIIVGEVAATSFGICRR